MHSRLERELHDGSQHVVELTAPEVSVGRREDCALVLNHAHVSRQRPTITETTFSEIS